MVSKKHFLLTLSLFIALFSMSSSVLAGSFLSTAGSLRVEVEVYKGPLSKELEIQWGEFEGLVNETTESLTLLNDGIVNLAADLDFVEGIESCSKNSKCKKSECLYRKCKKSSSLTFKPSSYGNLSESSENKCPKECCKKGNSWDMRVVDEVGNTPIHNCLVKWCEDKKDKNSRSGCLLMAQIHDDVTQLVDRVQRLKSQLLSVDYRNDLEFVLDETKDQLEAIKNEEDLDKNLADLTRNLDFINSQLQQQLNPPYNQGGAVPIEESRETLTNALQTIKGLKKEKNEAARKIKRLKGKLDWVAKLVGQSSTGESLRKRLSNAKKESESLGNGLTAAHTQSENNLQIIKTEQANKAPSGYLPTGLDPAVAKPNKTELGAIKTKLKSVKVLAGHVKDYRKNHLKKTENLLKIFQSATGKAKSLKEHAYFYSLFGEAMEEAQNLNENQQKRYEWSHEMVGLLNKALNETETFISTLDLKNDDLANFWNDSARQNFKPAGINKNNYIQKVKIEELSKDVGKLIDNKEIFSYEQTLTPQQKTDNQQLKNKLTKSLNSIIAKVPAKPATHWTETAQGNLKSISNRMEMLRKYSKEKDVVTLQNTIKYLVTLTNAMVPLGYPEIIEFKDDLSNIISILTNDIDPNNPIKENVDKFKAELPKAKNKLVQIEKKLKTITELQQSFNDLSSKLIDATKQAGELRSIVKIQLIHSLESISEKLKEQDDLKVQIQASAKSVKERLGLTEKFIDSFIDVEVLQSGVKQVLEAASNIEMKTAFKDEQRIQLLREASRVAMRLRTKGFYWAEAYVSTSPAKRRVRAAMTNFSNFAAEYSNQISSRADVLLKQLLGTRRERLPLSDFLRDSSPTDFLNLYSWNRATNLATWPERLFHPFNAFSSEETTDRVRVIERLFADQYWSKINTVYASGQGEFATALVKDDIGNWNLKSFDNDPSELLKGYADITKAAIKGAIKVAKGVASGGSTAGLEAAMQLTNQAMTGNVGSGSTPGALNVKIFNQQTVAYLEELINNKEFTKKEKELIESKTSATEAHDEAKTKVKSKETAANVSLNLMELQLKNEKETSPEEVGKTDVEEAKDAIKEANETIAGAKTKITILNNADLTRKATEDLKKAEGYLREADAAIDKATETPKGSERLKASLTAKLTAKAGKTRGEAGNAKAVQAEAKDTLDKAEGKLKEFKLDIIRRAQEILKYHASTIDTLQEAALPGSTSSNESSAGSAASEGASGAANAAASATQN